MYSIYFQAHVPRKNTLFFVATLRGYDHLCFDRTLDPAQELFEFFVPVGAKQEFIKIMNWYLERGYITSLRELPNRLITQKL